MRHRDDDKEKESELREGAVSEVLEEKEDEDEDEALGAQGDPSLLDDEKAWE